ncbi:MAG TPA: hypothetical protein VNB06_22900 [Thermoanaerobaculia bacterium]|nr:hypothetical protein [Thermoanaerobaculia bacterium]
MLEAIAGAGLDVYEREPQLAAGLAELDNVLEVLAGRPPRDPVGCG